VRRVHLVDAGLGRLVEGEERLEGGEVPGDEGGLDAVAGGVEEPDLVTGPADLLGQGGRLGRAAVVAAEVDDGDLAVSAAPSCPAT